MSAPSSLDNQQLLDLLEKAYAIAKTAQGEISQSVKTYSEQMHKSIDDLGAGLDSMEDLLSKWRLVAKMASHIDAASNNLQAAIDIGVQATINTNTASEPTHSAFKTIEKKKDRISSSQHVASNLPTNPSVDNIALQNKISVETQSGNGSHESISPTKNENLIQENNRIKYDEAKELKGNSDKLMKYFESKLNHNSFTLINQTLVSKESQIPLGSLTALLRKLNETGFIILGPSGAIKLGVRKQIN